MKRYVLGIGLAAIIAIAVLAQAGFGIKNGFFGNDSHEKMKNMQRLLRHAKNMRARAMYRNLLEMDREEGIMSYENGAFYVNDIPLYVGDAWWLNHTIRSDYDGDGEYELIWNELNGLIGSNVVINGRYDDGAIIVSHINGMFFRMPVIATFVSLNGEIKKVNQSYFIDEYKIILPNRMARSDYDGDGKLERMHMELDGLVGSNVTIDGYIFNDKIRPLHINGIAC